MFKIRQFALFCSNCSRLKYGRNMMIVRRASTQKTDEEYDVPIKYSRSPASNYKANLSRMGDYYSRLWYEPYVLLGSCTVFLVYFCILREENDIDKEFGETLYSRIDGLEEAQLKLSLQYNLSKGLDTTDIIRRLEEIELEKQKKVATPE